MSATTAPEYMFSPPSLRTRTSTRSISTSVALKGKDETIKKSLETLAVVPDKLVVKKPRRRPPMNKVKKDQSEDKAAWSPPPVKIQLLSPPESPAADVESTLSVKTRAAGRNQSRKTRRRIVTSKPVSRRKIR
ncbi:hypothetical protein GDO78_019421 [Eleutherodactylus coqui]|uniref:Uncharacterized protein n=2 Tax=Eleutherodactylus coqui TaxID=57060 RepID=A0A8J6E6B1_ELECQ|nr:hypothetical protein GDO78_019421 [Eleutherodactylus coqui]